MNDKEQIDKIRGDTLNSVKQAEMAFNFLLVLCGIAEVAGVVAVIWFMDWSDQTHLLIFAATMLVWVNLALWVAAIAVWNRVGVLRILRAIDVLAETSTEEIS